MPADPNPTKIWKTESLAIEVKKILDLDPNARIAFLLGAGCSKSSGIKLAWELVEEWLKELYELDQDKKDDQSFEEWLKSDHHEFGKVDPNDLGSAYPQVFEARYSHCRGHGSLFLEKEMTGKVPSYGYFYLAKIILQKWCQLAITTNFDDLLAETLTAISPVYPNIVNHETLAQYIPPLPRKPTLMKIHGDFNSEAKSSPEDIENLPTEYRTKLKELFKSTALIVIGYGGNDGGLMAALNALEETAFPTGLYWCFVGKEPPQKQEIQDFVKKQSGKFVQIKGFDDLVGSLAAKLRIEMPRDELTERHKRMQDVIDKHWKAIAEASKAETGGETAKALVAQELQGDRQDWEWWQWDLDAKSAKTIEEMDAIYREGAKALPNSAELHGNYASFLHTVKKDYDEAERMYKRTLEIDPNIAINTGNYATFLQTVKENYPEAEQMFKRSLAIDSSHAGLNCNYANFLMEIRRAPQQAEPLYLLALKLAPVDETCAGNYAWFLLVNHRDKEAAAMLDRFKMLRENQPPRDVDVAVAMCRLLCFPDQDFANNLSKLKKLLLINIIRTPYAGYNALLQRAVEDNHPHLEWMRKLVEVVNEKADISVLDEWPEWANAKID